VYKIHANIINEIQKILSRKKTVFFLTLTVLLPILSAVLLSYAESTTSIQIMTGSNFTLSMLWGYTGLFLPLFVMMVASDMFVGEVADRSLKLVLVRPISRFKVFLSKILAMGIMVVTCLSMMLAGSVLSAGMVLQQWNPGELFQNLLLYATAAVPMLVLGVFAVFVGQFFRSVSGAFASCVSLYLLAKFVPIFFPSIGAILFSTYTDWHTLWVGNEIPGGRVMAIFLILLSNFVLFFTAAFSLFDKKEL
jgi:ABC-2 type transport system permease protein